MITSLSSCPLGYRSAVLSTKEKEKQITKPVKPPTGRGGGGGGYGGHGGHGGGGNAGKKPQSEKSLWLKLIEYLKKQSLLPVVIFAFSKRRCEECAYGLTTTDLTTSTEKSEIHSFIESSTSRLTGTDRELPQVNTRVLTNRKVLTGISLKVLRMKDLLKRGVGVHHGGLLPIIKEMVEILFSRGLVKVLPYSF